MTITSEHTADETSSADNKKKIIAAGVLGALVLGYGGYTLLSGDDTVSEESFVPTKRVPITKAKVSPVKVKKAPAKPATVPAVSAVMLGRDPFLALYTVPVAAAPAAPVVSTPITTGGTDGGTSTPITSPPVAKTYPMKLVRVYGTGKDLTGAFSVDGKSQTAKVGGVFGATSELKLLSLQQGNKGVWTAVVQVGDADPFDAMAGQVYYVM